MKKLLAAALSGVLTAGIILGGTGLSTKAAERWCYRLGKSYLRKWRDTDL